MNRRPWISLGIFVVAIIAIVGHVCVVPHAHAADLHAHGADADIAWATTPPHDHPDGGQTLHGASCSGLRAPDVSVAPPSMARLGLCPHLVGRFCGALALKLTGADSPPLFLLHAALLI